MKPPIIELPAEKQSRLDQLLYKNAEGKIASEERSELESLVAEAELIMVANAKRLANSAVTLG